MSEKLRAFRISIRFLVALFLILSIVIGTLLVVRELPDDPNSALMGLLGTIFGGLVASLLTLTQAIARNASDREKGGED